MATEIKLRRGTKAQHDDGSGFTGAVGEVTVDTTDDTLRVHDGSLKGGHVMAKLSDVEASDTLAELLAKGNSTGSNDIQVDATDKVTFGAESGGKLEIYEDGSQNGIIKQTGTGALTISGTYGTLNNDSDQELISWDADNAGLSWRGNTGAGLKLFTKETGIGVTGIVTTDGLTADYIDLTGGESTTTTGTIACKQIVLNDPTGDGVLGTDSCMIYTEEGFNNQSKLVIHCSDDGNDSVVLRTDNDVDVLVADSHGIDVTGTVTASEGVLIPEGKKLRLGSETDSAGLDIYESTDGDSLINQYGDGNLIVKGQNILLRNNSDQTLISTVANTAQLFNRNGDNAGLKLETTNAGIDVTGTVTCDEALTISSDGSGDDAKPDIFLYNNATAADGERLGQITYYGKNSASETTNYGWHEVKTVDVTDGVEDSVMEFWVRNGSGNHNKSLTLNKGGIDVTGTVAASDGLTADYIDLTNGKSTTTTGEIAADKILFSAHTNDTAKIFAEVGGVNNDITSLVLDMQDDGHELIEHRIDGTTRLTVKNAGIDVTGKIECDTSLQITSSGTDVDAMPDLYMTNIEDAAAAQNLGMISFRGYNLATTPEITNYADVYAQQVVVTDGAEEGKLVFDVLGAGAKVEALQVTKDGIDVTGTVEADAFSGTNDTVITDFVTSVSTNDNDTTVPTTAAVKSYVDNNDGDTTYTGGTGLTLDGTTFNVDAAQTQITSVGTLSGLTTGATTVNGPLIATNDYHQFRSTNTSTAKMPLIEVFRDKQITSASSSPVSLGGFVFTGLNEDDRKVSYGSFYCSGTNSKDDGEHKATLVFTVADGSGAADPFNDYTDNSYSAGHSIALNITADYFITTGYLRSDVGELKLGAKQAIFDSADDYNNQSTYNLHMPSATKAKVMQIGGLGPTDSFIASNRSVAQMLQYRGQHMVIVAGSALEFELPACAASTTISNSTANIGDIFQISNAAGGALTIDRDGSGTTQTVYQFPNSSLVPFTNNPTLAVGGTMMLQAVDANTWMIFNPTGLTDA